MTEATTEVSIVLEFNPEIFDLKKEALLAITEDVSKITADPSKATKEDFELINVTKNKLVKARIAIAKAGKKARDAATQYNRDVKSYEDSLIAIIEPEEQRLKELEKDIKDYAVKQERLKVLPDYKQQLASIGDVVEVTDDELLGMDPTAFQAYYNARLGAHLQARQAQANAEAEATRLAKEAEEKAKVEAKEKLVSERVHELYQLGILEPGARPIILTLDGTIEVTREMLQDYSPEMFAEAKKLWTRLSQEKIDYDAKELQVKQEAEIKEAELKAKQAAEIEAKQEMDLREAKRLADEAEAKAKQEAEQKAAEAALQLQQESKKFQKWLSDNSYNSSNDLLVETVGETKMYRLVSTYKH